MEGTQSVNCPICGSGAYLGLDLLYCENTECANYHAPWPARIDQKIQEEVKAPLTQQEKTVVFAAARFILQNGATTILWGSIAKNMEFAYWLSKSNK